MQLSKHFKLEEFTKSMTATRKGIKNEPGSGDIKNLENVCYEILEPVRAKFEKPITVTSGGNRFTRKYFWVHGKQVRNSGPYGNIRS